MNAKDIKKAIKKAIKAGTDEAPVNREAILITLLTDGVKASTAMSHITKAFKDAGIIAVASVSALSECREYLKASMPDMPTYNVMLQHARDMQDKFSINGDDEKGTNSALKLIKVQLKEDSLTIPRKVQLGDIESLKVDYYNDPENVPFSVDNLADFILANLDDNKWQVETKETIKRVKVSAGTNFSYSVLLKSGKTLEEMNG